VSPNGVEYEAFTRLEFGCTNNQAEYEVLLIGLELLTDMGAKNVEIFGDSKLVVQQVNDESQCFDGTLNEYREKCLGILSRLKKFSVGHIPRGSNVRANTLAQQASGYDVRRGKFQVRQRSTMGTVLAMHGVSDESTGGSNPVSNDWRKVLIDYITNPGCSMDRKVWRQALKYTVIDGVLYR
jgi:ribonuclease HI